MRGLYVCVCTPSALARLCAPSAVARLCVCACGACLLKFPARSPWARMSGWQGQAAAMAAQLGVSEEAFYATYTRKPRGRQKASSPAVREVCVEGLWEGGGAIYMCVCMYIDMVALVL